ncbi:flagellar basal body M-ring protein FliF [Sesbania bispinosa]|nr:flagellar basal body M-ring protein FliF [Sesbania bispinosa]
MSCTGWSEREFDATSKCASNTVLGIPLRPSPPPPAKTRQFPLCSPAVSGSCSASVAGAEL